MPHRASSILAGCLLLGPSFPVPLAASPQAPAAAAQRLEEAVLLRTFEEQGGVSHASGGRPELGPVLLARVVAADARTLRVGLTPSAFNADGSLRLEYDTAAAHNHARVEVSADGPFGVVDAATGEPLLAAGAGETVAFERSADGATIAVGGPGGFSARSPGPLGVRGSGEDVVLVVHSLRRINRLAPLVGGSFQTTPAPYRGELEVLRSEAEPARLRLVNVIDVEPYVAGVVVNEGLSSFHVEALRAQAVAARGYALANRGRFSTRGFDIDDSTLSQVYRGRSSETATALDAQQGTLGLVATRDGRLISALYSSSMGGHTEDNEWVFPAGGYPGDNADPALRGIHDSADPLAVDLSTEQGVLAFYSTSYPGAFEMSPGGGPLTSLHRWTRSRSATEVLARLKDGSRGWAVPASASVIDDITVLLRGASGRVMQIEVRGDWGRTVISGWSDLRALATLTGVTPGGTGSTSAPNSPSGFILTRDAAGRVSRVDFYGGGFGHNVGMSQYGSHGRALRGQDYSQILAGYYSGVTLSSAPVLLQPGGPAAALDLALPGGRATLRVETAGVTGLRLEVGLRRLRVEAGPSERLAFDLAGWLRPGVNRLRIAAEGEGAALVVVERDALPAPRGDRR
jgi:peptidoglycan hydrolase-like amidase